MDRNQCISACFLAKLFREHKFLLSLCKPKTPVSVRYLKNTQAPKNQARTKKIALHEYLRGFAKCCTRMDVNPEQKKAKNAQSLGACELQNTQRFGVCSCSIFWQSLRCPVPLFSFLAVSSVPGASVQFFGSLFGARCLCSILQRSVAGALVRDAGPLLEPRVPPLVQLRAAPRPWSVMRSLCWNHVFRPSYKSTQSNS